MRLTFITILCLGSSLSGCALARLVELVGLSLMFAGLSVCS
jgi:hypothetical protein